MTQREPGRAGRPGTTSPRDARAGWSRAASLAAPLALAALLTGAAVVAVDRAGCDTPAHYVTTPDGAEIVGGCTTGPLAPRDDLPDLDDQAVERG